MNKVNLVKFIESLSGFIFLGVLWKFGFNTEGFRYGTISLMISLSALVVVAKTLRVPLTPMQSGAWILTMILGSMTLFLNNPLFLKLKTTFLYWGISFAFLVSHFVGEKTILERLIDAKVKAPRVLIRKISRWTVVYLTTVAFMNYYVATYYDTEIWTYFKYGVLIGFNFIFLAFVLYQLRDYLKEFLEENS